MLDPERASLLGRIGAHAKHAKYDPRESTAPARATFLARFELEVDPNGELPPDERRRRAEHARKAYFARLALRSSEVRRSRRAKPPGGGRAVPDATQPSDEPSAAVAA